MQTNRLCLTNPNPKQRTIRVTFPNHAFTSLTSLTSFHHLLPLPLSLLHRRRTLRPHTPRHRNSPLQRHRQPQTRSKSMMPRHPTTRHSPKEQCKHKPYLSIPLRVLPPPMKQLLIKKNITHNRRQRNSNNLGEPQKLRRQDLAGGLEGEECDGDVL